MKWTIDKKFDFSYAHRVHSQDLNKILSGMSENPCRRIHGHNAIVKVGLSTQTLDSRGFVIDFNEIKWFKKFLDDVLDHRMIIDLNDPLLHRQIPGIDKLKLIKMTEGYYLIKEEFNDPLDVEFYSSFVLVDFVPTSENFCKWFFDIVSDKLKNIPVKVEFIEYYETPTSRARIEAEDHGYSQNGIY